MYLNAVAYDLLKPKYTALIVIIISAMYYSHPLTIVSISGISCQKNLLTVIH